MPSALILPARRVAAPTAAPDRLAALSDDECVQRLADAVEAHDSGHLDQLAQLLGRLAVVIE
jgi:hypothetical protein